MLYAESSPDVNRGSLLQAPVEPDDQASQNLYDLTELPVQSTGWPHPGGGGVVVQGCSLDSLVVLADFF